MFNFAFRIVEGINKILYSIWRDLVKKVGRKTAQVVVITITTTLAIESLWFSFITGWLIYAVAK